MKLVRDILDKQAVDRRQTKIGKIDGLVLELRDGEPPRLAYIALGSVALARRLGPRCGRWMSRLAAKLGGERHREPHRIPWSKVQDVGTDIELNIDVRETAIFDWQVWLRQRVIGRIPGT